MSWMFTERFAYAARLEMFKNTFTLIRPLIYLSNDETSRYAEMRQFKKQKKHCPHEKATNRDAVSKLLDQMEMISPHARSNLFAAMQKYPGRLLALTLFIYREMIKTGSNDF